MKVCDFAFAFPALLLGDPADRDLRAGVVNAIVAIGIANVADLRQADARGGQWRAGARISCWPRARRGAGRSPSRFEHVLPNIAPALIVQATIQFAIAILAEAALSYLGLGAQPPLASWGRMLADAQTWLYVAPRLAVFPGLAVALSCSASICSATACATRSIRKLQGAALTCCSKSRISPIELPTPRGPRRVVRGVSFSLARRRDPGRRRRIRLGQDDDGAGADGAAAGRRAKSRGAIRFEGRELARSSEAEMRRLRGDRIAMIFQEPMTALNPLHRIGAQVAEPLRLHRGLTSAAAMRKAVELLGHVRLRDPERLARAYPFAALGRRAPARDDRDGAGLRPEAADRRRADDRARRDRAGENSRSDRRARRSERGMAILLVSHDLAVIARHCRRVLVMYGGAVMEEGPRRGRARRRAPSLYARPARRAAALRRAARRAARRHSRRRAGAGERAAGCPFAAALPADAAPVCRANAARRSCGPSGASSCAAVRVDAEGRPHMSAPLLEVVGSRARSSRSRAPSWFAPRPQRRAVDGVELRVQPAARSASSANRARASRRWRALVMALQRPTRRRRAARGPLAVRTAARGTESGARAYPDGVPGPLWLARSAPDASRASSPSRCGLANVTRARAARARRRGARAPSASTPRRRANTRTNSPAASASASPSRAR